MKYLGESQRHFNLGQARLFLALRKKGVDPASAHRLGFSFGHIFSAERRGESA